MSQMPQIKAEVNKEPQKDKKKAGLLGRLFGGGSGGGAMGTGGLGGAGGLAGGGGMLATKAGLMTLVLVGTTVAGGIGLVGYRIFGPGSEAGNGDNLQLFAARPKEAQPAEDSNAAPKDGSSKSLDFAAQANTTPQAPAVAAAPAPTDATAAGAASSASAETAAATSGGAINSAGNASSGVNKNLLKGSGKFGTLSSGFGGGGGGGGSASAGGSGGGAGGKTNTEALAAASRNGATGGMKKGVGATGGARAIATRKGANKAMGQAFAALKDGRGAQTSYSAGRTFDGSAAPGGMNAGPEGGAIGMSGPGTADGGAQPKSMPNNQGDKKEFKAPPEPNSVMAAPWQNAINQAQMMLALGTLLLFVLSKIKIPWVRYALGAIVLALGAAVIALGGKISGGEWGQKVQGGVLAAAGLGLSVAAVMAMMSTKDNTINQADVDDPETTATSADLGTVDTEGESESNVDILGGINPYVLLGGGSALVAVATCQMKPPEKHPSKDFENGKPPDANWFGYQRFPSENALKKMIA